MPDATGLPLAALLRRLTISREERLVFVRDDTAASLAKVEILTAAAMFFNLLAVDEFGGRAGAIRGRGLVDQVIAAAFQVYGDHDPHPGAFDKAAMLLRGITQGHPFEDGNKRTGFLVAALYLSLVGHPLPTHLPVEDVVRFSLEVSAGTLRDVGMMAAELGRLWKQDAD
jgi:death-on-curing protein